MKLLMERLSCPPLYDKMVKRRGTFFQRADSRRPPVLGIPKLIKKYEFVPANLISPLEVTPPLVNLMKPGPCLSGATEI